MSFADIFALIRKIGPRLPECWPHVLIIVEDSKSIAAESQAIAAILGRASLRVSAKAAGKVSAADAKKLIALCVKNGVSKKEAAKVLK